MAVCGAYVFPSFLTPVLTQLFFPKPPTTFLTCLCRGERRKYTGKKVRLNWGSNSQPPGHFAQKGFYFFEKVEIILGKGENALSSFPILFSKVTKLEH